MSATKLSNPIRGLARALFVQQVTVRREGLKLHFGLNGQTPGHAQTAQAEGTSPPGAAAAAGQPQARLEQARQALEAALNRHPAARRVMRHLDRLDRELATRGEAAIRRLPLRALQRTADQLESIAYNPPQADLLHLLELLRQRLRAEMPEADASLQLDRPSEFLVAHKLQVREVSHTDFMEARQALVIPPASKPAAEPPAIPPAEPSHVLEWEPPTPEAGRQTSPA